MKYRLTLRLGGPEINLDLVMFIFNQEPRVAYSRGALLPSGDRAEKGRWEITEYSSTGETAAAALQKMVDRLRQSIHSLRHNAGVEQIDVIVTVPADGHVIFIFDGEILSSLGLIAAELYCRAYEENDPSDPHWKVEQERSEPAMSQATRCVVVLRFAGADLKRDAVQFCFAGQPRRVEYYRGDRLTDGTDAASGRCEFAVSADTVEATGCALRRFVDQVASHRDVIREHFRTEQTDFVVAVAAQNHFVVDARTLARIALIQGRLELQTLAG